MNHRGNWEQVMASKHQLQIAEHERQFGKLGEPQTKRQKQALKRALAEQSSSR